MSDAILVTCPRCVGSGGQRTAEGRCSLCQGVGKVTHKTAHDFRMDRKRMGRAAKQEFLKKMLRERNI